MGYIVQKFGGTSVATLDLIKKTALRVKGEHKNDQKVVVVVSAMAGVTNTLSGYVRDLSGTYDREEYDAVVASGEQITAGLLALALQNIGIPSRSFMGWQVPIYTSSQHAQAKIEQVDTSVISRCLEKGIVPVVAGFQGLSQDGRITTLGRGGSDTTAVAIAAALKAERCDIYTDVDGVYTADPRYISSADKLDYIAYQEMLELAAQGAKVLQKESVEYAMKHQVPLRVLSSLKDSSGTLVTSEGDLSPQQKNIRGLAHSLNEERITLKGLPQDGVITDNLKSLLNEEGIPMDMFQHHLSLSQNSLDCTFTILSSDSDRTHVLLKKNFPLYDLLRDSSVAKISVIGTGLQSDHSPSHMLFKTLKDQEIDVHAVAASDIKLSVLIDSKDAERAVASLHTVYQLDIEEC
jgi:aspartate kinase